MSGGRRRRQTVRNRIRKARFKPRTRKSPLHVAVNDTAIQLTDERYPLYAALDPRAHRISTVNFFPHGQSSR